MALYLGAPQFAKPTPPHAQTEAAERARRAVIEDGRRRVEQRIADELDLVTTHLAYYDADPVTAGARSLVTLAESKGMRVQLSVALDRCLVEGVHLEAGVGFRMTWTRGRATGGSWHERETRWAIMHDERPGPDATVERTVKGKTTRVAHPSRMPRGLDRDHLVYLGGPRGVVIAVTPLLARLKAMP